MTATAALVLLAAGVVLDRVWLRLERTAERERVAEGLRRIGAAPSNCRVIPAPFDQERQS